MATSFIQTVKFSSRRVVEVSLKKSYMLSQYCACNVCVKEKSACTKQVPLRISKRINLRYHQIFTICPMFSCDIVCLLGICFILDADQ